MTRKLLENAAKQPLDETFAAVFQREGSREMCDAAIEQSFSDVRFADSTGARQVGDDARHLQHPVIAACRQLHALGSVGEKFRACRVWRGDTVEQFAFGFGVGADGMIGITRAGRPIIRRLNPPSIVDIQDKAPFMPMKKHSSGRRLLAGRRLPDCA